MAGLDPSTAATIAALVVAILAMLVAVTQAVQQYFVTGQLIRLCDSVVYGKMPGRGQRVWQMSQLRFRVVYCIPQVSLRRDLWPVKLPHIPSYAKGSQALPDLGLLNIGVAEKDDLRDSNFRGPKPVGRSSVCFAAGEASWVSFCRAVQPSSGRSMVLDLIQADADRCPPDLPNVPIQMSMRDIVVMGLMTGLKCTQASFESKSLSMQGLVGTITTSQHPLLGPLLHFSPRDLSLEEINDLQVGTGAVDLSWLARIWDEVVVAGHRYTLQERIQIERDEAIWAKRPRERAMVPSKRNFSPPPASLYGLRRRSSVASTAASSSQPPNPNMTAHLNTPTVSSSSCREYQTLWTRSDGDWHVDNSALNFSQAQSTTLQGLGSGVGVTDAALKSIPGTKRAVWVRIWTAISRKKRRIDSDEPSDHFGVEIERGGLGPGAIDSHRNHSGRLAAQEQDLFQSQLYSLRNTQDQGATLQPRWFIKDYIDRKRAMTEDKEFDNVGPRDGPLLLGWYDDEGQEVIELNETKENLAKMVIEMWARSETESGQQRAAFYAQKWRDVVRQRQLDRENRLRDRPLSSSRPLRNRSQSRSTNRYRSSDSTRSRRTFDSGDRWSQTPSRTSLYSSFSGHYPSELRYQRQPMNPSNYNAKLDSSDSSPDSSKPSRVRGSQSRSSSHVRSRPPIKRDVEYGDSTVSRDTVTQLQNKPDGSESPKSPESGQAQSHVRVEFGHEIHVLESSSSEGNASENDKRLSVEKASLSPRKESSKNRNDAIEPAKGILKRPKEKFPEEPTIIREGVAPLKNTELKGIPPGARWTKIDRRLVSPAALKAGNERFEEKPDYVIVLRVLQKEEIQDYAHKTRELREAQKDDLIRAQEDESMEKLESSSRKSRVDVSRGRRRRRDGSLSPNLDRKHSIPRTHSGSSSHASPTEEAESSTYSREDIKYRTAGVHSHSPPRSRPSRSRISQASGGSAYWASESGSRRPSRRKKISIRFNNNYSDSEVSEPEIEVPESHYGSNAYNTFHPRRQSIGHDSWNLSDDETQYEESRSLSTESKNIKGGVSWFWVCQMDVIPGYLATPWTTQFSTEYCVGAIAVIIEAIGMLTEFSQPVYLDSPCHPRGLDWMRSGLSTFPPYVVSANHHHGRVISGGYSTKTFPGFRAPLFQIELLRHYGFQVDRHQPSDAANLRARLTELMALDSWLSYCGRQPEICGHGPPSDHSVSVIGVGDLLYTMPKLIERTMESFEFEFTNLERTAIDGGYQIVRQIAGNLLDTLGWKVEGLSPAEKLFALVAMLRASKMALCIVQGTDTSSLREILLNDVQVHLV